MAYVIKRYSNRKLYDTQESRYVTLEEIEEMIRAGREITVVDAASGEDLTSVTLTQIILENERNHRANLPSAFLHQLIKHGEAWQEFVQRTTRSGWGPVTTGTTAPAATEPTKRDGTTDAEADKLREEVSALRDRLRSLEERLQKRKADAK